MQQALLKAQHQAMCGLLMQVLKGVAADGLPGEHHFYITFNTSAKGVDIPDWLRERHPDDMTIVLQEWFADLVVDDSAFSVTLNFGDLQVRMSVPFAAIQSFVDPSVDFGLKFEPLAPDGAPDGAPDESPMIDVDEEPRGDAEVVSLDTFRK